MASAHGAYAQCVKSTTDDECCINEDLLFVSEAVWRNFRERA